MTQTIARIKKAGKHFEIIVDLESALRFKKGLSQSFEAETDKIFTDSKKGLLAAHNDLKSCFGTDDSQAIINEIIKHGEIQVTQEHRDAEQEKRFNQVVDFLARNAIDPQTKHPHSIERIKNALNQSNVNIKNTPIENQIKDILTEITKVIPIKLETKRVKVTIPAVHTGRAYGVISQYKEEENWLNNGSLEVVVNVPTGMIMDFYDKLNSMTQGSVLTEEIKE